ncbi:DUF4465 domain-containing protein [Paludisphaera rhizosphaerae]|uniref:DUF4465 domain-containing protein n=1 Tax=Paludisphaera rhizosphaerae TaxID=2711216 RepID=UPI0013ED1081|nr:DUF4465 domain-containing protein [Paludisphaera rhizosphaerae]
MRLAPASTRLLILVLVLAAPAVRAGDIVSTYSNVPIGSAESFVINSASLPSPMGGAAGYTVDGNFYNNVYASDPTYGTYWSGWAFSNQTTASAGAYFGQFSAVAQTTAGNTYAVVTSYTSPNPIYDSLGYVDLAAGRYIKSLDVTNVEYVYNAVTQGINGFDTKFAEGDYLTLTIQGYSAAGATGSLLGSVSIDLARYGTSLAILTAWQTIDLTSLGASRSLNFVFSTNVANAYGPIVPTYAAIDNLTTMDAPAVPEPSTWVMLGIGALGVVGLRRGRGGKF